MTERNDQNSEDVLVWADGTWATREDQERGDFDWMSDDFEIVRYDDVERLTALGLAEELGLVP